MNTQSVQIGDLILRVLVENSGVSGKVQNMGRVSHLGVILDNGDVKSFMARGMEIYPGVDKYEPPNRWAAVPLSEQWPEALLEYIKTFPEAIRERVIVARGSGGNLKLVDRETLRSSWIKFVMIKEASFAYNPESNQFDNGKLSVDESWTRLVIADREVDLPGGFEAQE